MEQSEQARYATERLAFFRSRELDKREEKAISDIERVGCHVLLVTADRSSSNWAYTLGVHDTCGKPEIIVVGLPEKTAHFTVNEAHKRLRAGVDLLSGRHADFLEGVDVEFRPVDPKWIKPLMGWALWYNCGPDFPVIQLIYPDKQNRFPKDSGFDKKYDSPLLQSDAPDTGATHHFWTANDPASSFADWKFPDAPHTLAFLSKAVHEKREPITYVSHEIEDGAWQFLGPSMSGDVMPVISCLHHPVDNDPTLKELADLPLGWCAERATLNDPWVRYQEGPEDEDQK